MIFGGRVVIVPGQTDIPVTGATSGYARVVITIDLSKTATKTAFEQAALDVQYATSINGFPALTKEAINNGGTVTVTPLAVGTAAITVTLAEGINYLGATKTVALTVSQAVTYTVFGVCWDYSLSSPVLTRLTPQTDPLYYECHYIRLSFASGDYDGTSRPEGGDEVVILGGNGNQFLSAENFTIFDQSLHDLSHGFALGAVQNGLLFRS